MLNINFLLIVITIFKYVFGISKVHLHIPNWLHMRHKMLFHLYIAIIDKFTRNFKQTLMLCLNHLINWALNAYKSITFVNTKAIIIVMIRCCLFLINHIGNILKYFWKIIDCCFITVGFRFFCFLFGIVKDFLLLFLAIYNYWIIALIWFISLSTSFNSWIVVLNVDVAIRLINFVCLCIFF